MSTTLTELTEALARKTLAIHRLAKAADEASQLKSPTTRREHGDVSRPTEETALCPRRNEVRKTSAEALGILRVVEGKLSRALDVWEGNTSP